MNIIKNETLYNISLESPLLRDADLLSSQSIAETWRGTSGFWRSADLDASLRRRDALEEWVGRKVLEGERSLDCAGRKVQEIMVLEREVRALESLGENVL